MGNDIFKSAGYARGANLPWEQVVKPAAQVFADTGLTYAQLNRKTFGLPYVGEQPGVVFTEFHQYINGQRKSYPELSEYHVMGKGQEHDVETLKRICVAHASETLLDRTELTANIHVLKPLSAAGESIIGGETLAVTGSTFYRTYAELVTPEIQQLAERVRGPSSYHEAAKDSRFAAVNFSEITESVANRYRDARYGYHSFGIKP